MATKEEDFKDRFVAVLQDLRGNGGKDPEAMFLIGSLAARLIDRASQPNWAAYKANMTPPAYAKLLSDFQQQGNDFHKEGKAKHAYAIQVLAISLIARTRTILTSAPASVDSRTTRNPAASSARSAARRNLLPPMPEMIALMSMNCA